jgi:hypothetical protein
MNNPPKTIPSAIGKLWLEAPAKEPTTVITEATGTPGWVLNLLK